ncbi:hypothetical protein Goari_018016, partial [Gossypium aridum]|nr:hypothetical protein [Gossypium aridum]
MHGNIPSPFATEALACFQATEMGLRVGFFKQIEVLLVRTMIDGIFSLWAKRLEIEGF